MNTRRRVQAGATTSHLSIRNGNPVRLELELADGTRLELELAGVVSWGVSCPGETPTVPALVCTDRAGKRKRARLDRLLAP